MEDGEKKNYSILKVGLTGGIGSGKSTVSQILREKGMPVVDADVIAREVLNKYPEILLTVKETFGDCFFDNNGNLNRREFGNFIFKDEVRKNTFENLIIPYIKKEIDLKIEELENCGEKVCIVDAPTLIENNMHKEMNFNILVWVDRKTQISRVIERDLLTDEEVINRINAQISLDEKKEMVDYVIDNSKSLNSTKEQLDDLFMVIKGL